MLSPSLPTRFFLITCRATIALTLSIAFAKIAPGQEKEDLGPLYQQPPFDRVVLKTGESVNVRTLRFKDGSRTVPSLPPASGSLNIRLYNSDNASVEHEIPWSAIARIDLFDDLVLQEALKLTDAGKFDDAYGYFGHLLHTAPKTRDLDAGINKYLQANALAAYRTGEFDRALAILGSLYERAPSAAGLAGAVDTVAGKIIEQHLQDRNYQSARLTLDVVEQNFQQLPVTVVKKWRGQFEQAAQQQLAEAKRMAEAREYLAARQAIGQAIGVWPEIEGADELQARIQREHPVVRVGVADRAPRRPTNRLDSWASSRAAVLVSPTLVELRDYSTEGGVYESSVARIQIDDSAMGLTIELAEPPGGDWLSTGLGASAFARNLLAASDSNHSLYQRVLADLVEQVYLEYPRHVRVTLTKPHVRPESLLTLPMPTEFATTSDRGLYVVVEQNDTITRFVAQGASRPAIAEIHEVPMADDDAAVTALLRGLVDVIDRVPPWQLPRLRAAKGVTVDTYRLPTIHALVPTGKTSLTKQREFRRALCYGLDRQRIVRDVILGGNDERGFQVVSGPFPAGVSLDDPLRRGYNSQIKPRDYDPYLAIVLASAAWSSTQKRAGVKEPSDDLPVLKLGHNSDPVARTACLEISKSLGAINIPIELVELSTEDLLDANGQVDLKYIELSVWEPVTDARRLLGLDGPTGDTSDFMLVALDRLDEARNWNDAASRLYEIHDVAHSDLPIIPLWQTINYFAYRSSLEGISERPVRLYQDMGQWQIDFGSERL
ncbi:MAG: ABC transporter substrate-binding protein [Aeoliella sp.]